LTAYLNHAILISTANETTTAGGIGMKKYNLSRIMKRAWEIKKQDTRNIFSICLKISWEEEKERKNGMDVKEFVEKYGIFQVCHVVDGETVWENTIRAPRDKIGKVNVSNVFNEMKARKAEIIKYFEGERAEKERQYQERKRKIASIEGLAEIKAAYSDLENWYNEFEKSFDGDCGGLGVRPKPEYDIKAMREQYHVADAYLKAESEAYKSNYELSAIGKRALEKIIEFPENYKETMEIMEAEIKDFTERHMWD